MPSLYIEWGTRPEGREDHVTAGERGRKEEEKPVFDGKVRRGGVEK
jgi:hypothetical protein